MITQISKSHPHVVMKVIGNGNRKANPQNPVRKAQRVDISVAQE